MSDTPAQIVVRGKQTEMSIEGLKKSSKCHCCIIVREIPKEDRMSDGYPNDADGDALRGVVRDGSDMSRPMVIDFFVAVPNKERGQEVAAAASTVGYDTRVLLDDDSKEWTCYCSKSMLATYEAVISAQKELAESNAEFEGYSDGWGTFGNVDALA